MAASLNTILAARKLTQAETARVLGVNQPKVSALKGYKLEGFSVERLMHFATALYHEVVIEIRPHAAATHDSETAHEWGTESPPPLAAIKLRRRWGTRLRTWPTRRDAGHPALVSRSEPHPPK